MTTKKEIEASIQQAFSHTAGKFLVAVSTGVDSMVLLDVMETYAKQTMSKLGVVHVNHGLRKESLEEELFLQNYCKERDIPFFATKWQPTQNNIEANARIFRYTFFKEVMKREGYEVLLTAHHSDDQLETMIMKLVREGELSAVKGIVQKQELAEGGFLIRPLLTISKEKLSLYARDKQLPFFEDQTNQSDRYFRNRMRHQVIPLLKKENIRTAEHFQQVSEQIVRNEQLLEELVWLKDKKEVKKIPQGWQIAKKYVDKMSEIHRNYFFDKVMYELQKNKGIMLSKRQLMQVEKLLKKEKPQWQIQLGGDWVLRQSYDQLILEEKKKQQFKDISEQTNYELVVGSSRYLTDCQWIGLFIEDDVVIPDETLDWEEYQVILTNEVALPLTVRKREAGDRLQLNAQLRKRVSRWLIDQKIPNDLRADGWFVSDFYKNGVVFLPFIHSCLSIPSETDKIRYVLLYKYQK